MSPICRLGLPTPLLDLSPTSSLTRKKAKKANVNAARKKLCFKCVATDCWENAYDLMQTGECYWLARVLSLSGLCKVLEQLVQKETVGSGQLFSLCFAAIPAK